MCATCLCQAKVDVGWSLRQSTLPEMAAIVPMSRAKCLPICRASEDSATLSTPHVVPVAPAITRILRAYAVITHTPEQ